MSSRLRRHVSKRAAESTFVRLRSRRTQFGAGVRVSRRARLLTRPGDEIILGDGCVIFEGALLATYGGHIRLGTGCTVNPYTVLYGHGGLDIGDHVRIAAHVLVVPANHVFEDPDVPIANQGETRRGIVIEDDVWIGAGAIVLDGVTVGSGAVIGAGSVVTQKIPELAVAVGNPARVVRYRGERQTMPIGRTA